MYFHHIRQFLEDSTQKVFPKECEICDTFVKIFSYYALCLIIVATIGNFFSSFVCFRKSLQKISTFKIYALVFIFEALCQYTWILDIFLLLFIEPKHYSLQTIDDINIIESYSVPTCKIFTFNQYYSLHCISWLYAYASVDQILKIYFPKAKYNLNQKYVYIICGVILTLLFLLNCHILLFAGKQTVETIATYHNLTNSSMDYIGFANVTYTTITKLDCFKGEVYSFWPLQDQIHLFVFCFVPFCIMIASNFLLIKKIYAFKSKGPSTQEKGKNKKRTLAITVVLISLGFIICSLPQTILFGYFFVKMMSTKIGHTMLPFSDLVNFTFIGCNFCIQLLVNKVFRSEWFFALYQIRKSLSFYSFKVLGFLKLISSTKIHVKEDLYRVQNTRAFYDNLNKPQTQNTVTATN